MALDPFPADDPVWATDGLNLTAPIAAKQELGWELGEEPASAYFNWWQNLVWQYIDHYKTAVAYLESDKLSRQGGEISGSYTFDFDQGYNIGSDSFRLQTLFTGDVDAISVLPYAMLAGSKVGSPSRPWSIGYFDSIEINNSLASPAASFENVSVGSALTAEDLTATDKVTADEVIVGEFGHSSARGVRELDVTRATLVIDKPASTAFVQGTHEVHQSNVGVVSVSGNEMTVNLVLPMNGTKYGVHISACRGVGTGQTDLVMAQVFGKTTALFKVIFYYWDGSAWTAMSLDTTSGVSAVRAVINVVGRES